MMRVLITGGAGFIGSHIAAVHVVRGDDVLIVDDLSGGADGPPDGCDFRQVDIGDSDAISTTMSWFAPHMVSHHAALVSVRRSRLEASRFSSVNVVGTVNVLEACVELSDRPVFIMASSGGAVYGEPDRVPIIESDPIKPISIYGITKACAEMFVDRYSALGLRCVTLRYGNVYGYGQRPDVGCGVISIFTDALLSGRTPTIIGDGSKVRDYVHIDDVVRANLAVADGAGVGKYNVGTGVGTTDRELYDIISSRCGVDREPEFVSANPDEVLWSMLDCERARTALGWKPIVDLDHGIDDTIEAWKEGHGG